MWNNLGELTKSLPVSLPEAGSGSWSGMSVSITGKASVTSSIPTGKKYRRLGKTKVLQGGDVVHIHKGQKHAIKAVTALELIELQIGNDLSEDDIECFEWIWP